MADDAAAPRGYTATAVEFLDVSAEDSPLAPDMHDLAVRQLAATQAIGYALLAVADQLADPTDAAADSGGQLGGIAATADLIAGILDPAEVLGPRAAAPFRRLFARRASRRSGGAR